MSNKLKQLKIILQTNASEKENPLTYASIYNPSPPSENQEQIKMSEYPFFIETVPYPEEVLKRLSYNDILKTFFNKETFIKNVIGKNIASDTINTETIEKNIMIMLDLLFPTSYPINHNINTSYNKYLKKSPYKFNLEIRNAVNAFFKKKTDNFSYIKIDGKTYTVSEIVWLNDIINHPTYKKLVNTVSEYNEWAEEKSEDIQEKKNDIKQKFTEKMNANDTSIRINDEDKYILLKEKRIFTEEDVDMEIKQILNYFVIFQNPSVLNTLDTSVKDRSTRSTISDKYKKIINNTVKFKNTEVLNNGNSDYIMKQIYTKPSDDKKKDYDTNNADKIIDIIYKSCNKFKKSKDLTDSRPRELPEIQNYDSNVEKIIQKIEELNKMKIENVKIDIITSYIESIYDLFEKIKAKSNNQNELRNITTKMNELSKFSKEIKSLILVEKYILYKNHGIMVDYEKNIKDEYEKKIFSEEIKKITYKPYNDLVDTYKKSFLDKKYKSMNIELQKLLDTYFKYENSDFIKKIVNKIDDINKKKINVDSLWNVSAASYELNENDKSEPNTIYKKMEIYVYMNLIADEINATKLKNINCEYSNNRLIEMFNQLIQKGNKFNLKKDMLLKIEDKQSNNDINPSEPEKNNINPEKNNINPEKNNINPEKKTGGKKSRRNIQRNKKTRKWRKYY